MEYFNNFTDSLQELPYFQVFNILIAVAIALIFAILSGFFSYILVKIFQLFIREKCHYKKYWIYQPSKIFFTLLGIYLAMYFLKLPENILAIADKTLKICIIFLIAKCFVNLFNDSSNFFKTIRRKLNFKGNDVASSFVSKIIAGLIYTVAGFIIISELGYDLGGLATGLGISSVVIAFTTQDLIKSLFSGFSIIYEKAFDIGDFIETNDFSGTVEDITFKSTRIRNLNNQSIIIPNSMLIDSCIINSSKIDNRRYYSLLTLELNTPLEKVLKLTDSIKFILMKNENILDESVCVFFDKISNNGIDLYIHCYSYISNLEDFRKLKEDLNYEILKLIEKSNISLAYPSQTVYLKKDF